MKRILGNPFAPKHTNANPVTPPLLGGDFPLLNTGTPTMASFNKWSTGLAITDGLKASEWVYTAVTRIATAASSVPWKVYQTTSSGRAPYVKNGKPHPIEYLLANPNPWLNGGDWLELLTQHLYLGGNSVNRAVMMGDVPVSILPLMPDNVDVIPGTKALIDRYDWWIKRDPRLKPEAIPVREVLHIKFTDPGNLYWGIAPLQSVSRTVDTDVEAVTWNKISLQNRAVADGAFVVNSAITLKQWQDLRTMLRDQHQGPNNAHTPWVLGYGMDWKPMAMTPQELDFIQSRKMNRESILAVYNVPPPVAGLYDSATYNNLRVARTGFWLDTVIPYLDNLRTALEFYFRQFSAFGTDWTLDYDLSGVEALKPELKERVDAAHVLWTMGVPLSALNQRFELDLPHTMEYADVAFVSGVKSAKDVVAGTPLPLPPPISPVPTNNPPSPVSVHERFDLYDPTTVTGRDAAWTDSEKHRTRYERALLRIASTRLHDDYTHIATAFAQDGIVPTLDAAKWRTAYRSIGAAVILDAGTRTMRTIRSGSANNNGLETFDDATFSMDEEVIAFLEEWTTIRADQYNSTTIDQCYRIIKTGQDEGLTIPDIVARLEEAAAQLEYRAVRIAATESVCLQNRAIILASKQSGVVESKVWISSRDVRVRDSHKAADGQTIGLNEKFSVGNVTMDHPADFSSSASESVHCRCTVSFVLKSTNSGTLSNVDDVSMLA